MLDTAKKLQKIWDFGEIRTALAAVCAHSVSISIGICQGYSAILIPQLLSSDDIPIDSDKASWLASLGAISNPIGSILSGVLAEVLGRRRSIQISSIPFIVGWVTIATSNDIYWLYAGRFITGISAGMSTASYTYVAEISTPENRGLLQAIGPICASLGILLTYTLGYFIDWHILAYISIIFSILTLVSVNFVPESPSWLIKKCQPKTGLDSLIWLRRSLGTAELEYNECLKNKTSCHKTPISAYFETRNLKPFFILLILFFLQELSGIYNILFYTVSFFQEANINLNEYISSIIVGFIRFIMAIFAAFLINKYARKKLCLISSAGMCIFMLISAIYIKFYEINTNIERAWPYVPLLCFFINVFFSMVGILPIPWILTGEVFPLDVRSIMSGTVVCFAQIAIFACVKIHPSLVQIVNFSGMLFIFSISSFLTIFFVKFILPETKNLSLQDIENYFSKGVDNFGFEDENEKSDSKKNKEVV